MHQVRVLGQDADGETVLATPAQLDGAVVKARVVGATRGYTDTTRQWDIVGVSVFALLMGLGGLTVNIITLGALAVALAIPFSPLGALFGFQIPSTPVMLSLAAVVAATVAVPGYILGEVFLSFLGVGVQPPAASWGNMLNAARSQRVLTSFPWMFPSTYMAGLLVSGPVSGLLIVTHQRSRPSLQLTEPPVRR